MHNDDATTTPVSNPKTILLVASVGIPFTIGKAKSGAIVIKPDGPKDIFYLPSAKLKKLVQGCIWRDEHFDGLTLREIARREDCSEAYVGTAIFSSFDILQSAQSPF